MNRSRRDFFKNAALGAGALAGTAAWARQLSDPAAETPRQKQDGVPTILPVETPDVPKLEPRMENGAKVFHLIAEPVKREFLPRYTFDLWGYNGSVPGPTIEARQGDRVRIIVENHLPEPTSMHWHGFEVPIHMDGVPGVCQDPIPPGGRYFYEFTLHQEGTFFYHSHMAMQEMMGMIGMFIMHPKIPYRPKADKDFGLILQEFAILPNNTVPNSMSMEFNWLTINGKAGPATTPLIVKLGERVRIRLVNLGMDHHPMHLHGNTFYVTGTEAGRAPESAWRPENTALVGVAQARDVEFDAKYPGDWMLHCHLPHHMMNHMASMVGPLAAPGGGMPAGMGMGEGMGMLRRGGALATENGPSLGRAMGVGAEFEKPATNMPLGPTSRTQHAGHGKQAVQEIGHALAANPQAVPGFPQDMFMPMDAAVAKPETCGLRRGWSGGVQGMTTLVRVLEPELYETIMELKRKAKPQPHQPAMSMPMPHRRRR